MLGESFVPYRFVCCLALASEFSKTTKFVILSFAFMDTSLALSMTKALPIALAKRASWLALQVATPKLNFTKMI